MLLPKWLARLFRDPEPEQVDKETSAQIDSLMVVDKEQQEAETEIARKRFDKYGKLKVLFKSYRPEKEEQDEG